jgi:hypothetical protein
MSARRVTLPQEPLEQLIAPDDLRQLQFSKETSELLAYKITAFKLFENIKYSYWVDKLVPKLGIGKDDKDEINALNKRLSQWRGNPNKYWKNVEEIFPQLRDLISREKQHSVPPAILNNLDSFIPHSTYHALYALMKMTPGHIANIRRDIIGGSGDYNVFHYSCQEIDRIVVGNCRIWWDGTARAVRTHEEYKVGSSRYELGGYLVQPDHTYRIFSKHTNSNQAQVILLDRSDKYFGRHHPKRKGQFRRLYGVLIDNHLSKYFYATRIVLRRIDTEHLREEPRTESKLEVERMDKTVHDFLEEKIDSSHHQVAIF